MSRILDKFHATVDLLQAKPGIELRKSVLSPPAAPELIRKAEQLMRMTLSDDIREFYSSANGFTIEWTNGESDMSAYLYGWIDIWPLEKMIGGENGSLDLSEDRLKWVFEEMLVLDGDPPEAREELAKHRMIESHWGAASYTTITFGAASAYTIYYFDNYEQCPLPLSFTDYVMFTLETLGVDRCRLGLKAREFYRDPYAFDRELKMVKDLFPETDVCNVPGFCSHPSSS